jgi:hypothetical protein
MNTYELLKTMKESVELLKAPEVTKTSVGIQLYIQGNLLQRQIDALEKEIEEENAYIDLMAERLGY